MRNESNWESRNFMGNRGYKDSKRNRMENTETKLTLLSLIYLILALIFRIRKLCKKIIKCVSSDRKMIVGSVPDESPSWLPMPGDEANREHRRRTFRRGSVTFYISREGMRFSAHHSLSTSKTPLTLKLGNRRVGG